jgi:hypothetical protein
LIGPGTDNKTRTRRRSERDVKPREMEALERIGWVRILDPLIAGRGMLNISIYLAYLNLTQFSRRYLLLTTQ